MDFVAGVSHELRNPLTAIQSAGFNLSKGTVKDEEKIRKYGQVISKESRRLTHMVEQVLSYAGIQSSGNQYHLQSLRIEEIVEKVLQDYSSVIEEGGWKVEVEIDEELPSVSGDGRALESCLSNLIDNALKYAAEGKALRLVVGIREDSGKSWVDVSVRDEGPGISGSELRHIFDSFYRGQEQVASPNPGAGLGLALVKRHVEAHGGKVRVFSKIGKGSTFQLSLPIARKHPDLDGAREVNDGS
jgi:two-component system phosphate regulon sensor histidine kinase PhoR